MLGIFIKLFLYSCLVILSLVYLILTYSALYYLILIVVAFAL